MEFEFLSASSAETRKLAARLGKALSGGEVIALVGDLGAGKTVFAKGLAEGLEVMEPVTSPTFTLVREYKGRLPFYHIDAYRLTSSEEGEEAGLGEYFGGEGVVVVEWPQRIWELIPKEALTITISPTEEGRRLSFGPEIGAYIDDLST